MFGAFLREEVADEVGHCLWTFTVPKLLRPFFLHRRELLGELCRAAWQSVAELIAEAAGDAVRPGMVAAVHTAASDLRWHPHIHAIASRGGWDQEGVLRQNPVSREKAPEAGRPDRSLIFEVGLYSLQIASTGGEEAAGGGELPSAGTSPEKTWDGTRRPRWLIRPVKPVEGAYRL